MKVFVDTSGLFAALVKTDEGHHEAKAVLDELLVSSAELSTTSYVVAETMALLQTRVGLSAALAFEQDLRPLLRTVWIDEELHRRACQRLSRRARRLLSLVDCTSFVVMEDLGLRDCLALDAHFEEEGFRRLGASPSR